MTKAKKEKEQKKEIAEAEEIEAEETQAKELKTLTDNQVKEYIKSRNMPINNLDSAWLSAVPDYTIIQNTFNDDKMAEVFEFFNASIRLGNISGGQAVRLSYRMDTAGYALSLGKVGVALMEFFQIANEIELSHGVKGFRTKAMNMIIQKIDQTQSKDKKKNMFGKRQDND